MGNPSHHDFKGMAFVKVIKTVQLPIMEKNSQEKTKQEGNRVNLYTQDIYQTKQVHHAHGRYKLSFLNRRMGLVLWRINQHVQ